MELIVLIPFHIKMLIYLIPFLKKFHYLPSGMCAVPPKPADVTQMLHSLWFSLLEGREAQTKRNCAD